MKSVSFQIARSGTIGDKKPLAIMAIQVAAALKTAGGQRPVRLVIAHVDEYNKDVLRFFQFIRPYAKYALGINRTVDAGTEKSKVVEKWIFGKYLEVIFSKDDLLRSWSYTGRFENDEKDWDDQIIFRTGNYYSEMECDSSAPNVFYMDFGDSCSDAHAKSLGYNFRSSLRLLHKEGRPDTVPSFPPMFLPTLGQGKFWTSKKAISGLAEWVREKRDVEGRRIMGIMCGQLGVDEWCNLMQALSEHQSKEWAFVVLSPPPSYFEVARDSNNVISWIKNMESRRDFYVVPSYVEYEDLLALCQGGYILTSGGGWLRHGSAGARHPSNRFLRRDGKRQGPQLGSCQESGRGCFVWR